MAIFIFWHVVFSPSLLHHNSYTDWPFQGLGSMVVPSSLFLQFSIPPMEFSWTKGHYLFVLSCLNLKPAIDIMTSVN